MFIETVPNRNSPPAVLLRESYREGKRVKKRTLANLSQLPAAVGGAWDGAQDRPRPAAVEHGQGRAVGALA
jgi:hypothetical protein